MRKSESVIVTGEEEVRMCVCVCVCVCVLELQGEGVYRPVMCVCGGVWIEHNHMSEYNRMNIQYSH